MSYLLGAYGFALAVLAGYTIVLARRSRAAAGRVRELDREA